MDVIQLKLNQQRPSKIDRIMIEQFQKLLQTPRPSEQINLKKVQDTMLNTMQQMMPENFDFGQLAKMFAKQNQYQNLSSLTLKLTEYFTKVISQNFISLHSYFGLQQQTQKLQSTVRSHIKMEQEMKMYLQHLQYKIERYEYHLRKLRKHHHNPMQFSNQQKQFTQRESIDQLKKKETQLMKERLILLRKVDYLERRLKDQEIQLRRLNSPTSATIQQIKEGLSKERQISQTKLPQTNQSMNVLEINRQELCDRRLSTNSFGSDHQLTQKKTSIPNNPAQSYRMYSQTGREQNQQNGFSSTQRIEISSTQKIETQKQIGSEQNKGNCQGDWTLPIQLDPAH